MALRPPSHSAFAVAIVLLVVCVSGVAGHGRLQNPAARQVIAWQRNQFYNPNGGNGAQTGSVGVCGDPFEGGTGPGFWANKPFNEYNINLPRYAAGSRITLNVELSANHGGKFGFAICDRTSNLDQACFDRFPLTRADLPGERWFWMPNGAMSYTQDWILPAGLSCPNGCVMQWVYYGMQSSVEAGCNAAVCGTSYSRCVNPVTSGGAGPGCGTNFELFRNCADIIIFGTSGPTPPTPSPSPPTPPTPPSPGPVPSPPVGCVDTYAACPGWGPGQCGTPGVATYCPCMCRGSTGPVPPGPTPPPPPPPTGCNDNRADCTAWGPGLCSTPGVAQTCPCMCGLSG